MQPCSGKSGLRRQKNENTQKEMLTGEQIKEIIPQREPMLMIDTLYEAGAETAVSGLTIGEDNILCSNGKFTEMGLMEHIAQTCAAFNGCRNRQSNASAAPKLGYIGEIKNCKVNRRPGCGERLRTTVTLTAQVMNVNLMAAETKTEDGETIATCQIKLFEEE